MMGDSVMMVRPGVNTSDGVIVLVIEPREYFNEGM